MKRFLRATSLLSLISLFSCESAFASPTSTINPALPTNNSSVTSPVLRSQFTAAYNDINALWSNMVNHSTTGQILFNNAGVLGGFNATGDCTISPLSGGTVTCSTIGGLNPFNSSNQSSGTLPAARLPTPTTSTLGGILALASSTAHQFLTYIDSSGAQHLAQPAFTDISGSATPSQLPLFTSTTNGIVSASGGGTSNFLRADGTWTVAGGLPGGSSGALQYNNGGVFGGYTMGGDCTLVPSTGVITCTKTSGVAFAPSATTDTTNASNITSGTLPNSVLSFDPDAFATLGTVLTKIKSFATNTVYAAGTTTYSSGAYAAPAGAQPLPTSYAAGQVFFVNFNQSNPSFATLNVGGIGAKPLKVVNGSSTVLTMTGGEIIAGPATVYYDGTEFIYSTPFTATAAPVTMATTATQSDFVNQKTYYLTSGAQTITLPCANTLSQNGAIKVFSVSGLITIAKGSSCSDTLNKNGATGTSLTILQGAPVTQINTDGASNFYLSGT